MFLFHISSIHASSKAGCCLRPRSAHDKNAGVKRFAGSREVR